MTRWLYLIWCVVLSMAVANAAWIAYWLAYLASGVTPVEFQEANIWLARGELAFAVAVGLLSLVCLGMLPWLYNRLRRG